MMTGLHVLHLLAGVLVIFGLLLMIALALLTPGSNASSNMCAFIGIFSRQSGFSCLRSST